MKKSPVVGPIHAEDWYKDRAGKTWAVTAVDVEKRQVRLRLVDRVERNVSIDVLRRAYTLAGLRALERKPDDAAKVKKAKPSGA